VIFRRLEGRYSEVIPAWRGETVAVIASGPSLTKEQTELVREAGFKTIVINNSYLLAPWADVLYFADFRWWEWHKDKPEYKALKCVKVTIQPTCEQIKDDSVHALKNWDQLSDRKGLCLDPTGLMTGRNSGYQALNLAVLAGAKRVVLLGYDMKFRGGRCHFHAPHPIGNIESEFLAYAKYFSSTENQLKDLGVEVINTCMDSKIEAFRKEPLESVVADKRPALLPA
jgi:hypothetical protein